METWQHGNVTRWQQCKMVMWYPSNLVTWKHESIKHHTRVGRKKGHRQQIEFSSHTKIPEDFLTDDSNKAKLNDYLCNQFAECCPVILGKEFCISNKLINVFTSDGESKFFIPT